MTNSIKKQKTILGYCPTMKGSVISIAKKKNCEPVLFNSAAGALSALKNKQINKVLIGRKAKLNEISKNTKETVIKTGYTLVTIKKIAIENSQLPLFEVHTYVPQKIVQKLFSKNSKIIYHDSKEHALDKINEGKIVLIPWEDWQDRFELFVVTKGNEKDKNFRGEFLYEI